MSTYRWGIIGAGNIAAKFASALRYTEGAEVFAVASRDSGKGNAFAEKFGASHIYTDYAQLAADEEVDVIYIATPHAFHCEQALMCLDRHKPVLCEKPMALNYNQVSRMAAAAKSSNTFLMEGMWSRFMPSINKVLELIKSDVIGNMQCVRADFGFAAPYNPQGRLYNLQLGGGALLDVGIYPLFLTHLLLGQPSLIQSMGKLADTGADEYCSMQFQYPGGQTASIFSSITIKTGLTADIIGTKGRVHLSCPWYKATEMTVILHTDERQSFSFPYEHNGFEYEIREVMRCLDQGLTESPLMPLDFSLQMAATLDTVMQQCGIVYHTSD